MASPARTAQAVSPARRKYAPHLHNDDLAPVRRRTWGTYSIFALWMADTHAISNYTFAAGLFVLGLAAWQVFLVLLIGITIVYFGMNLMGHAGHRTGVPFPVLARVSFGVYGANIPAMIRAIIAIAWYGIQTWLASVALVVLAVQLFPALNAYTANDFLGLSTMGWAAFGFMWVIQLVILSRGMETIRKVQDWATGPLVWIVMLFLAGWLLVKADFGISLTESLTTLPAGEQLHQSVAAVGLTIATFLTLILNYGDFARFTKSHKAYRRGNLLGLPLNFSLFALASVLTTAGAISVFGDVITEPVEIVARIDNTWVTVIGAITFVIATVGINIVANFVSPAYDLANLAPNAVGAVLQPGRHQLLPRRARRVPRAARRDPARRLLPRAARTDRARRPVHRRPGRRLLLPEGLQPRGGAGVPARRRGVGRARARAGVLGCVPVLVGPGRGPRGRHLLLAQREGARRPYTE